MWVRPTWNVLSAASHLNAQRTAFEPSFFLQTYFRTDELPCSVRFFAKAL